MMLVDDSKWDRAVVEAERDLYNGVTCKENQDNGRGPCGVCVTCLRAELTRMEADRDKFKAGWVAGVNSIDEAATAKEILRTLLGDLAYLFDVQDNPTSQNDRYEPLAVNELRAPVTRAKIKLQELLERYPEVE